MEATILDLRYRMNDVLKALDRNEIVTVLYHGVPKGQIIPVKSACTTPIEEHPLFNSRQKKEQVDDIISKLRSERYHDV